METITAAVGGMDCEACVGHVTRALKDLPGVGDAKVSLHAGSAIVTYDPNITTLDVMRNAVVEEGYTFEPQK
jgi:Cu+-exporting ATPase